MKLSLTAIAALFAATLHPSVATGTRAASTTINTEEKPDRDLEDLADFNLDLGVGFGDPMEAYLGDTTLALKATLVADQFQDWMQVQHAVGCIMDTWGEQVPLAGWGIWLTNESKFGWFYETAPALMVAILKSLADENDMVTSAKLLWLFNAMPDAKRTLFVSSLGAICARPLGSWP